MLKPVCHLSTHLPNLTAIQALARYARFLAGSDNYWQRRWDGSWYLGTLGEPQKTGWDDQLQREYFCEVDDPAPAWWLFLMSTQSLREYFCEELTGRYNCPQHLIERIETEVRNAALQSLDSFGD